MAAIVWTDVTGFAPELATLPVTAQDDIIAYVNAALSVSTFGGEGSPKYRLARIFLAAHMGTLAKRGGGAAGPVISSTAGRLSKTYAVLQSAQSGGYGSTSYGAQFEQLLNTTVARVGTVA